MPLNPMLGKKIRRSLKSFTSPWLTLFRHNDEICAPAGLPAEALIGNEQGGPRSYQWDNAIKRFRRKLDPTVPPEPEPSAPPAEPGIILVEHAKSEKA